MKKLGRALLLPAVGMLFTSIAFAAAAKDAAVSRVPGVILPTGYRDWRVISVAHEAGSLNDIRVVLGNDIAIAAFRREIRPFPDGAMIVRLAYQYVSSAQNNAVFGKEQSFVAGMPINIQIIIKDSNHFKSTGGWGYGQFKFGKPDINEAISQTCFACHKQLDKTTDLVFTRYAQ